MKPVFLSVLTLSCACSLIVDGPSGNGEGASDRADGAVPVFDAGPSQGDAQSTDPDATGPTFTLTIRTQGGFGSGEVAFVNTEYFGQTCSGSCDFVLAENTAVELRVVSSLFQSYVVTPACMGVADEEDLDLVMLTDCEVTAYFSIPN